MRDDTRKFYERAVAAAVARIVSTLDDALDLAQIARGAALSPLHFHRIFKGMMGETPLELHRRLRLERAAWQLVASDAPVTRIAFDAGYETHESFTRAFREAYAASPSELRAKARAAREGDGFAPRLELASPSGVHFSATREAAPAPTFARGIVMQVDIETLPEQRVLVVEHRGPYNAIGTAFARLGTVAGPSGLFERARAMVALYHDDPETTPAADLRAEAGLVVGADVVAPPELSEVRIPAGTYARTTHVGPYERLGDTWARFMGGWLASSGHRVGPGPAYERYENTPMTAKPEELRTVLYVSIEA